MSVLESAEFHPLSFRKKLEAVLFSEIISWPVIILLPKINEIHNYYGITDQ